MAITRRINMNTISNESEIWKYFRGKYKGYTDDLKVAKRIMNWNSVERCSIYYTPSMQIFAYDFIFHTRTHNRVSKVLGLTERKKSLRRIKKDQRLQESDRMGQVNSSNLPAVEV